MCSRLYGGFTYKHLRLNVHYWDSTIRVEVKNKRSFQKSGSVKIAIVSGVGGVLL